MIEHIFEAFISTSFESRLYNIGFVAKCFVKKIQILFKANNFVSTVPRRTFGLLYLVMKSYILLLQNSCTISYLPCKTAH